MSISNPCEIMDDFGITVYLVGRDTEINGPGITIKLEED